MSVVVATREGHPFTQDIRVGELQLQADEPTAVGGEALGPTPHELVLAGLGACKSMTMKMYATRKGWPLASVRVELTGAHVDGVYRIHATLTIEGDLTDEQRQRLREIADRCPVHRTLTGEIAIASELV